MPASLRLNVDPSGVVQGSNSVRQSLRLVKNSARETGQSMDRLESRTTRAMRSVGRTSNRASVQMEQFGTRSRRALRTVSSEAGRTAGRLRTLAGGFAAVGAGVAGLGLTTAVRDFRDLDLALAEVSTLIEGTARETEFLETRVNELASTFGGTAVRQANAFYQALSAGAATVQDADRLLIASNTLRVAGVTDVTTATNALLTVLNSYDLETTEATNISDKLFATVRAGRTTIDELASDVGRAARIMAEAGVTADEYLAAIAALTSGGLSTSESVTALRGTIAAIIKPTTEAAKFAEELGISFGAAALEGRSFTDFMREVQDATGGSIEQLTKLFGSVESLPAVLALAGSETSRFAGALNQIQTSRGATQTAFGKVEGTPALRLERLQATFSTGMRELGDRLITNLLPVLEIMVDHLSEIAFVLGLGGAVFGGARAFKAGRALLRGSRRDGGPLSYMTSASDKRMRSKAVRDLVFGGTATAGGVYLSGSIFGDKFYDFTKDAIYSLFKPLYDQAAKVLAPRASTGASSPAFDLSGRRQRLIEEEARIRAIQSSRHPGVFPTRPRHFSGEGDIGSSIDASTFISGIPARAAKIKELKDALENLRDTVDPLHLATRRYNSALEVLDQSLKNGLITSEEYKLRTGQLKTQFDELKTSLSDIPTDNSEAFVAALERTLSSIDPLHAATSQYKSSVAILNKAFETGALTASQYAHSLTLLNAQFDDLKASIAGAANAADEQFRQSLEGVKESIDPLYAATKRYNSSQAILDEGLKRNSLTTEEHGRRTGQLKTQYDELKASLTKTTKVISGGGGGGGLTQSLDDVLSSIDPVYAATKRYNSAMEVLNEALKTGALSHDDYNVRVGQLKTQFDELTKTQNEGASAAAKFFTSIVNGSRSAKQALQDLASQLSEKLLNAGFEKLINSAVGGGSGDSFLSFLFSAKGNAFGPGGLIAANDNRISKFQRGGVFDNPTMFGMGGGGNRLGVLGEAGPEAILPLARDADGKLGVKSKNSGGGVTVNIAYDIDARGTNNEAVENLRRDQQRDRAQLRTDVVRIVNQARQDRILQ